MTPRTERDRAEIIPFITPGRQPLPRLYYRPDEIAEVTGLSRSKVYQAIYAGELPCFQRDKCRLVAVDDLHAWIRGEQPTAGEQAG